jgi:hypothetical protein
LSPTDFHKRASHFESFMPGLSSTAGRTYSVERLRFSGPSAALAISEVGHYVNAVDGDHVAGFHVVPIDFRQRRNFGYLVEISLAAFPQFLRRAMRASQISAEQFSCRYGLPSKDRSEST